jgi:photosystem II stability/assembly factor-like uncharacterized protein
MSDDERLTRALKSAIGYVPPSPSFGMRPLSELAAADPRVLRSRPGQQNNGLLALVAALLALAIVVTLVAGARALHVTPPTPVHPAPPVPFLLTPPTPIHPAPPVPFLLKTTSQCPVSQGPLRMFSATTGWAKGPYWTTDGGRHWTYAGPPNTGVGVGVTQFFLDADHAWVAVVGGSGQEMANHVAMFSTVDGGHSWRHSAEMAVKPARADAALWTYICFLDPQNGFLALQSVPPSWMGAPTVSAAIYRTSDGGLTWTLLSDPVRSAGLQSCWFPAAMAFSSLTDGWIGGCAATLDGGVTWFPYPPDSSSAQFFDARHGVVVQQNGELESTSDGGTTWVLGTTPCDPLDLTSNCGVTFADPLHGWCLIDPTAGIGIDVEIFRTTDGGRTWSQPVKLQLQTYLYPATLDVVDSKTAFLSAVGITTSTVPVWPDSWQIFKTTDGGQTWTRVDSTYP